MPMKVQLRTLPTQVAAVLVRRIANGEFLDGRAPSELQISVEFGVSRAVAREALKILSSLDMVEIAQGRRVTLRPIAEWDYLSPLLIEWLPQAQVRELLLELHDARLIFEPPIAARAARSLTNEDLTRLRQLLDAMVETRGRPARLSPARPRVPHGNLPGHPQSHPRPFHVLLPLVAIGKPTHQQSGSPRAADRNRAAPGGVRGPCRARPQAGRGRNAQASGKQTVVTMIDEAAEAQ